LEDFTSYSAVLSSQKKKHSSTKLGKNFSLKPQRN